MHALLLTDSPIDLSLQCLPSLLSLPAVPAHPQNKKLQSAHTLGPELQTYGKSTRSIGTIEPSGTPLPLECRTSHDHDSITLIALIVSPFLLCLPSSQAVQSLHGHPGGTEHRYRCHFPGARHVGYHVTHGTTIGSRGSHRTSISC